MCCIFQRAVNNDGDHWGQVRHKKKKRGGKTVHPGGPDPRFIGTARFYTKVVEKLKLPLDTLKAQDPIVSLP